MIVQGYLHFDVANSLVLDDGKRYKLSLRFFLLAHFDLCKGKSSRVKKDTQM